MNLNATIQLFAGLDTVQRTTLMRLSRRQSSCVKRQPNVIQLNLSMHILHIYNYVSFHITSSP